MFENRLLEARRKKGLTQKQVAAMAGIHVASYSAYENNHKMPPADILARLSDALEVSMDWLCGRMQNDGSMDSYGAVVRNILSICEALKGKHTLKTGTDEIPFGKDWCHEQGYAEISIFDPVLYDFFTRNEKFKEIAGEEDKELYVGWLGNKLKELDHKPLQEDKTNDPYEIGW